MELRKKLDLAPSLYATMSSLRAGTGAASDLGDINCREVYSAARRLGLVHTAGALLAETCPHTDRSTFQAYSEVAETALRIQNAAWLEVRTSLASADIEPAALKGIYFLNELYGVGQRYICNDIDFLIKESQVEATKTVLGTLGFSQQFVSHDGVVLPVESELIERFEGQHYELFPFTRMIPIHEREVTPKTLEFLGLKHPFVVEEGKVFFAVELDVHHNLSTGLEEADIAPRIEFSVDGRQCYAVSPTVLAWFLPARFYHEVMVLGERKGKLLADIVRLIERHRDTIDWNAVAAAASRYSLEPGLLYVYRFLHEWCGVSIPEMVFVGLKTSAAGKTGYHDWGDFIPKLLDQRVFFDLRCLRQP